jgi:hypothetical protein
MMDMHDVTPQNTNAFPETEADPFDFVSNTELDMTALFRLTYYRMTGTLDIRAKIWTM